MLIAERALVLRVDKDDPHAQRIVVRTESEPECAAICYPDLTGPVAPGAKVIVNTTAVRLGLGSGGAHFVIWVEGRARLDGQLGGHIVKLRYTPMQVACGSTEENGSHLAAIEAFDGMHGMPAVCASCIRCTGRRRAVCSGGGPLAAGGGIMTDGGALPAAMSLSVKALASSGLIAAVITAGHASWRLRGRERPVCSGHRHAGGEGRCRRRLHGARRRGHRDAVRHHLQAGSYPRRGIAPGDGP